MFGSLGQVLQKQLVHALLGDSHDLLSILDPNAKGVRFFVVRQIEVGTREVIRVKTSLGSLRLVDQAQPFIQVFLGCWVLLPKRCWLALALTRFFILGLLLGTLLVAYSKQPCLSAKLWATNYHSVQKATTVIFPIV